MIFRCPFRTRALWSQSHCLGKKKKKKNIYWSRKHNELPFCTHVCTGWVLLLQHCEPKERLFTTIFPFPRKGWGPPGNTFSPHWIPSTDSICLIHLFPVRMPHPWQCWVDPSGGWREGGGGGRDGADERQEKRQSSVLSYCSRGDGWDLPWTQTSLLTEGHFGGGDRAEGRGHRGCHAGIWWVELKLCLGARSHWTRARRE